MFPSFSDYQRSHGLPPQPIVASSASASAAAAQGETLNNVARAQIKKSLHVHAVAADLELAERVALAVLKLSGTTFGEAKFGVECATPATASVPTLFVVSVTHVNWLTQADAALLFELDHDGGRVANVLVEARAQRVRVRIYYEGVPRADRKRELFTPLPKRQFKALARTIDWPASGVHNATDQRHLVTLIEQVYNMRSRIPLSMRSWIEPIVSTDMLKSLGLFENNTNDDGSESSACYVIKSAHDLPPEAIMGYCVRFRCVPELSTAFVAHLSSLLVINGSGVSALRDFFWIAGAPTLPPDQELKPRANAAYGALAAGALIRGALDAAHESELAFTLASAANTTKRADLHMHPGTPAPTSTTTKRTKKK